MPRPGGFSTNARDRRSQRQQTTTLVLYGRGTGVGRGLGVGPALGVGVTRGVDVGDAVAVAVGLAVGVAVGVDVGVGVGVPPPTAAKISTRPQPNTLFGGPASPH
jgi:hypothetical protein